MPGPFAAAVCCNTTSPPPPHGPAAPHSSHHTPSQTPLRHSISLPSTPRQPRTATARLEISHHFHTLPPRRNACTRTNTLTICMHTHIHSNALHTRTCTRSRMHARTHARMHTHPSLPCTHPSTDPHPPTCTYTTLTMLISTHPPTFPPTRFSSHPRPPSHHPSGVVGGGECFCVY